MDYLVPSFVLVGLDSLFLSLAGGIFGRTVKKIQGSDLKINMFGAVMSYILAVFVLYNFIIHEKKSPNDAFLLGLAVYGIFDFTNMAIFKNYHFLTAIIDMIWGGILFYLVTFISYKILRI